MPWIFASERPDSALAAYERYLNMSENIRLPTDQWYLAGSHKRAAELYAQDRAASFKC